MAHVLHQHQELILLCFFGLFMGHLMIKQQNEEKKNLDNLSLNKIYRSSILRGSAGAQVTIYR